MTENEKELIRIIRESKHPEQTLIAAFELIFEALRQVADSQECSSEYPKELVETD